jgi:methionine-gamma-lyase
VACADEATAASLRRVRAVTGALLHPLGAYLLHRGLATLPVRVRHQQESAQQVAGWLARHRLVEAVYYPGLNGDPRGLLGRQMHGPGAMISAILRGGFEQACRLTDSVRLFSHAVSLGGVDSLVQHPAALTHRPVAAQARPPQGLVRFSIGLEDPGDLIADLDAALGREQDAPSRSKRPGGLRAAGHRAKTEPGAVTGPPILLLRDLAEDPMTYGSGHRPR